MNSTISDEVISRVHPKSNPHNELLQASKITLKAFSQVRFTPENLAIYKRLEAAIKRTEELL